MWAFSCTYCKIFITLRITGTLPFNQKDRKETVNLILNRDIDFTHVSWKEITQEGRQGFLIPGKDFILKLLKKNPDERPKPDDLLKDEWF